MSFQVEWRDKEAKFIDDAIRRDWIITWSEMKRQIRHIEDEEWLIQLHFQDIMNIYLEFSLNNMINIIFYIFL